MIFTKEKESILALFNLENKDVEDVSLFNESDKAVVHISLCANYPPCPSCGNTDVVIKGYEMKKIKYGVLSDRNCILFYKARRYRCPVCRRTYYEQNPFVFKSMKISAMTVQNVLRDLKKQSETFSSVAARYHISPTSAASIFDQHVMMHRLTLPELMVWDEAYAFFHKGENSKYVFTILDYKTRSPVDILPSRRQTYLLDYFLKIPIEERNQVKMIATDMYNDYRTVIHKIFPHTYHCADRYHVCQELSRKVDRIRIRVMKSVPKYIKNTNSLTDEYYLLKKFNWLIFKRYDSTDSDGEIFDPGRERKMNNKLQRMLNYYDIRMLIEAIHPDLKAAWQLKDDLVDFYENNTYETAPQALKDLIRRLFKSGVSEMIEFAKTLRNWSLEIINSFIVVDVSHKVDKDTGLVVVSDKKMNTNALEMKNSILKTIKKNSNGYACWDRFRNRCLYVLRPDAKPILNPIIPEKTPENH